jgi:hypothetical protein
MQGSGGLNMLFVGVDADIIDGPQEGQQGSGSTTEVEYAVAKLGHDIIADHDFSAARPADRVLKGRIDFRHRH